MPPPFGLQTYRIDPVNSDGTGNWVSIGTDTAEATFHVKMTNTDGAVRLESSRGARTEDHILEESITLSGATVTSSIITPDGIILDAITARVTTTITGCTSWKLGIPSSDALFGSTIALGSGTVVDFKHYNVVNPTAYADGVAAFFTAVGGGASFTGGVVSVAIHYRRLVAPAT